jgi:hypothetical protein
MKRFVKKSGILISTAILATVLLLTHEVASKSGGWTPASDSAALGNNTKTLAEEIYTQSGLGSTGLPLSVFQKAYNGYATLKKYLP